MTKKYISIIEDNVIFRENMTSYVQQLDNYILLGVYEDFETAFDDLTSGNLPDIILMDIGLPGINGIEGTKRIKQQFPNIELIIVTVFEDSNMVFEALKAGACGYLTKSLGVPELNKALADLEKGGAPMSNKIAKMVVESFQLNHQDNTLSKREKEVLTLLAKGKTYSNIAEELFISKTTVRTHIRNIYQKLHVNSKAEAIQLANEKKMI
ncbi:LuxR family two component transcriptional regulator [Kordia periserrulae]|uniref:LuxR family two component transcriptional regulator n=1 Tax=Kordia periserrulae TaxID=701523 RepID=A0A2T6C6S2_9FLAO|nr:response regulator transcription factor [Kordia periserrulae]PTX64012.1 LuxR family two component transcriptional regulator [Kordia periserrulae]